MQIIIINLPYLKMCLDKTTVGKGIDTTQIGASNASLLPPSERLQYVNEQFNV